MQANLDMGGNRIINVGSPVDDNDVIRLVDIVGLEGGGGGIVTWDSILGKPSSFTPSAHTHTTDNVTGLVELIEDTMGSKITAGTNVSVAYNDGTGTVTISASGLSKSGDTLNSGATLRMPEATPQTYSDELGWRGCPPVIVSNHRFITSADAGKVLILKGADGDKEFAVNPDSLQSFPIGMYVVLYNLQTNGAKISLKGYTDAGTGRKAILRQSGSNLDRYFYVLPYCAATIMKVDTDQWLVMGTVDAWWA